MRGEYEPRKSTCFCVYWSDSCALVFVVVGTWRVFKMDFLKDTFALLLWMLAFIVVLITLFKFFGG